jgi:hypothetical protein
MATVKDTLKLLGKEVISDLVREAIAEKNSSSIPVLQIAIEEQRRAYAALSESFERMGVKIV